MRKGACVQVWLDAQPDLAGSLKQEEIAYGLRPPQATGAVLAAIQR
jgi:hypothetical protein